MLTEVNRTISQNFERGLLYFNKTRLGKVLEASLLLMENSKVKVGYDLPHSN